MNEGGETLWTVKVREEERDLTAKLLPVECYAIICVVDLTSPICKAVVTTKAGTRMYCMH